MELRVLSASDAGTLHAFLEERRESSMFLRSNARRAGLVYGGEPFQMLYVGAFDESSLVGVVAHGWNGMICVQAPNQLEELVRYCTAESARTVKGFSGPAEQVRRARAAAGMSGVPTTLDDVEGLFALDLADLLVPAPLSSGAVECRTPRSDEVSILREWRVAYDIETLGAADSEETRARATTILDMQIADDVATVAVVDGQLVSLSALNAVLPDIVQIGGVYTPPALRSRGYAKASVAGSLMRARRDGAQRAVLFASRPDAQRCYVALGFRRIGDYGLVLFA
jgi:hypothetical protein